VNALERLLHEARSRERAQTLFYRLLARDAEMAGDEVAAERINGLLADEQHHVSRVSARLLELGFRPGGNPGPVDARPALDGWEQAARRREADEVAWYERAMEVVTDDQTRAIFAEILASERHHRDELRGKWMAAESTNQRERE
jgi:rubrerythrin